MRIILLCVALILVASKHSICQGKLLLVGGGSENKEGWSDLPYKWMVDNAANHKIAIISYSDADQWLPNYFEELGAINATNVQISSRNEAESDTLFQYLLNFDALFFKGGDQYKYYNYYKDTPVNQAIDSIYKRGGVIGGTSAGMAILSGVMFTAKEGSAYPIDVLRNVNSSYVQLANDFLDFYPQYIFDTHFIERGRNSRLIGFMANWFNRTNHYIGGIGIDDRTALCIDENGLGTVYGTGAASIYQAQNFLIEDNQLVDSKVWSAQIIHGETYNLKTKNISRDQLKKSSEPTKPDTYYNVLASGTYNFSENKKMFDQLSADYSDAIDSLLIITDNPTGVAADYQENLLANYSINAKIIVANVESNSQDSSRLRNNIRDAKCLLFIDLNNLEQFFSNGPTGELLKGHITRNNIVSIFIGNITNRIGTYYSTNLYSDPFNAYYGDLSFMEGLNIIPNAFVATQAFNINQKDYYENISSAMISQLLERSLHLGVLLSENAYIHYRVNAQDSLMVSTEGDLSSLLLVNNGTSYERTDQKVNRNDSRLQYAFDSLQFTISKSTDYNLGSVTEKDQENYVYEDEAVLSIINQEKDFNKVKVNPVNEVIRFMEPISAPGNYRILDNQGSTVLEKSFSAELSTIPVHNLNAGMYYLFIQQVDVEGYKRMKFLKR